MKYSKHIDYTNSEVSWLGELPEHWRKLKIKRLTTVKRGASPRPIDDLKYFDEDGEYAWVRIADLTASERYLFETSQRLSELGKSLSVVMEPGNIFLSIAATVGKPIITKIKCCIHDGFVYFPLLQENREFFYYIFSSEQPYLGLGKLGTQLNLNTDTVGNIYIGLPPKIEQDLIVDFLDYKTSQIDTLIEKKENLLALLEEKRIGLITNAVTKGLNPNIKMKSSGVHWLGDIPEHWYYCKTMYLGKIITGGTPSTQNEEYWLDGNINWLNSSEINKRKIYEVDKKITELGVLNSNARIIPAKSVLIALNGQGKTKGMTATLEVDSTCSQSLAAIVPDKKINYKYLYYYLESRYSDIRGLVGEARDGLNLDHIKQLYFPIPPLKEQQKIVKYIDIELEKIDSLSRKIEENIGYLKEYRTSLITSAVTGKIDLRNWQPPTSLSFIRRGTEGEVADELLKSAAEALR